MNTLKPLESWFDACPGALIAFSGGVDSSLVAYLAQHFLGRDNVLAVISASPSLKLSDLDEAKNFARKNNLPLRVITTEEMKNPDYFNNPSNRCYFCKHTLYDELKALRAEFPGWWVLNGTNADDLGDYRPGLQAADEFAVRSPLVECGIDKAGVRHLAEQFALECWDKPASPCLSSRVPYGEQITVEKLRQIEDAEAVVKAAGFSVNRVRHLGETARVEVPVDERAQLEGARAGIVSELKSLGFSSVEFDEEGFVSGKLNRALLRSSAEK
ncbi:MAG TPA: ATP-dependent sacrificial sulfur transferase LarE [Opitutae bacterium]|nr:ATP-dependent sacrificial sulfur transferase LarE [Opitutae bacterium]